MHTVPGVSGLQRWCSVHEDWVPAWEATEIRAEETGPGPGRPAHACWTCISAHGLHTISAAPGTAFIGRRDAAPERPVPRGR